MTPLMSNVINDHGRYSLSSDLQKFTQHFEGTRTKEGVQMDTEKRIPILVQKFLPNTVVPPNSQLIGSKKNRELVNLRVRRLNTVVNHSSKKLLLSKNKDI